MRGSATSRRPFYSGTQHFELGNGPGPCKQYDSEQKPFFAPPPHLLTERTAQGNLQYLHVLPRPRETV